MALRQTAADLFLKSMNGVHRAVLAVSRGRIGSNVLNMPAVQLHTTGRRSGRRRSTMLTAPIVDGDTLVVVASKGGDDRHPDWYQNLLAHPAVEVTRNGTTRPMTARPSTAEERAEMWPRVVAAYRGYSSYQQRTEREIPLVVLEPDARN